MNNIIFHFFFSAALSSLIAIIIARFRIPQKKSYRGLAGLALPLPCFIAFAIFAPTTTHNIDLFMLFSGHIIVLATIMFGTTASIMSGLTCLGGWLLTTKYFWTSKLVNTTNLPDAIWQIPLLVIFFILFTNLIYRLEYRRHCTDILSACSASMLIHGMSFLALNMICQSPLMAKYSTPATPYVCLFLLINLAIVVYIGKKKPIILHKNRLFFHSIAIISFIFLIVLITVLCFKILRSQNTQIMASAVIQLVHESGDSLPSFLLEACEKLAKCQIISDGNPTSQELQKLAEEYGLDEVTITDAKGKILASSKEKLYASQIKIGENIRNRIRTMDLQHGKISFDSKFIPYPPYYNTFHLISLYKISNNTGNQRNLVISLEQNKFLDRKSNMGLPILLNRRLGKFGIFAITRQSDGRIMAIHNEMIDLLNTPFQTISIKNTFTDSITGDKFYYAQTIINFEKYDIVYISRYGMNYYSLIPIKQLLRHKKHYSLISASPLFLFLCLKAIMYTFTRFKYIKIVQERTEKNIQRKDLLTAKTIQMSALPTVLPPSPWEQRLDVFAIMNTAYEVGGDFYDAFYLGFSKMAFFIADVSDKGIPAAMFMMRAKSLLQHNILTNNDLAIALEKTNQALCQNNTLGMFVTAWVGIIDKLSGSIEYVNAGHNPPYIRHANGTLTKLDAVSGFFLGGLEDTSYRTFHVKMKPEDIILLYTDGVTEAENKNHKMFGEDNLERLLQNFSPDLKQVARKGFPAILCREIIEATKAFANGYKQSDDLSLLAIYYQEPHQQNSLTFPIGQVDDVIAVTDKLEKLFDELEYSDQEACNQVLIATDEIVSNVAKYSTCKDLTMKYTLTKFPLAIFLEFTDSGKPFNFTKTAKPNLTIKLEERPIGGLGVYIVKSTMDATDYQLDANGCNHLKIKKRLAKRR